MNTGLSTKWVLASGVSRRLAGYLLRTPMHGLNRNDNLALTDVCVMCASFSSVERDFYTP